MKSSRSSRSRILLAVPVALLIFAALTARGDLAEWLQNLESNGRFEAVFFRTVTLAGAPVSARRLPVEARNV